MTRITREMVVKGVALTKSVEVSELGEGATLTVKPLTDSQYLKIQGIILKDLRQAPKESERLSLEEITERDRLSKKTAVAYALSVEGEEWTVEDVDKLGPGVIDKVYEEVSKLSGFFRPPPAPPSSPPPIVS